MLPVPTINCFKLFRLLIPLLCCVSASLAQQHEPLVFKRISGLSQNTIYSIQFDPQHFMWLGTSDGINRYDGTEVTTYKPLPQKTNGALQGRVIRTQILPDEEGNLWFSTESNITCFIQKNQRFVTLADSQFNTPSQYYAANPIIDYEGAIWCISESKGLISINKKTHQFRHFPVPGNGLLYPSAVSDSKHYLWASGVQGMYRFDLKQKRWSHIIRGQKIELVIYANQQIYYAKEHELFKWDEADQQSVLIASLGAFRTRYIRCSFSAAADRCWIGDNAGNLFQFNAQNESMIWKGNVNNDPDARSQYPVLCVREDEAGQIWVGTDVLGLQKASVQHSGFHRYPHFTSSKTPACFIKSIWERSSDEVWLGTYEQGLIRYNPLLGTASKISLPIEIQNAALITLIQQDSKGNLWISANGVIHLKKSGTNTWQTLKLPLPEEALMNRRNVSVLSLKETLSGWIAATQIGLFQLTEIHDRISIQYISELGQTIIIDTWPDLKNHQLWVGYENNGLAIYNNQNQLKELRRLFYNNGAGIKCFQPDLVNPNLLWIASMSGLIAYHLPTGQYRFYQEADGLANSFVYGIIPTPSALWVSTNQGISKASLTRVSGTQFPEIQFSNYGLEDGLPALEFNTGAFHRGASGRCYFGSINGLSWFKPDSIQQTSAQIHLNILQVAINNLRLPDTLLQTENPHWEFAYHQNYLYVQFRGIEWRNPDMIRYSYQMEGLDNSWIQAGHSSELRYNNIPPGTYKLVIRATAGNSSAYKAIQITIHPPFWNEWWFYVIAASLFVASIILATATISRRKLEKQVNELKRQQAMELERQRISREMHDDIGAGLTQITLMSEFARRKIPDDPELEAIAQTSRNLISSMSEIIWSLQPQHRTLEQLLAYLREQMVQLLEAGSISYQIDFPVLTGLQLLEPHQMRNILLIGKEIIHNAVKHSKASMVHIQFRQTPQLLEFSVTDNGCGFDTRQIPSGNGLRHLQQRSAELGAALIIQSAPDQGTHIHLKIPLKSPGSTPENS